MDQGDMVRRLIQRVYRLEQEVAALQKRLGVEPAGEPEPEPGEMAAAAAVPTARVAVPGAPPIVARPERESVRDEANIIGAWLGRSGAIAILIGAGFGFKYAVDQGFIGPTGRVLAGLLAGAALIAWGEYARGRGWDFFSQAITGGGLALLYLSILAASHLYDLLPSWAAFLLLGAVALGGVGLALRHDSAALAALATVGGFLNPFLATVSTDPEPTGMFVYVLALDLIVGTTLFRRWQGLDYLAAFGTLAVYIAIRQDATFGQEILWSSVFVAVFVGLPFARSRPTEGEDVVIPVAASLIFYAHVQDLLGDHEAWQGPFALMLVAAFGALALVARDVRDDRVLTRACTGLAAAFALLFVPAQLNGTTIVTAWAVQGAVLAWVGARTRSVEADVAGRIALAVAALVGLGSLSEYQVERLLISPLGVEWIVRIAALGFAAAMWSRDERPESRAQALLAGVVVQVMFVGWLSAEIWTAIGRSGLDREARDQASAFSLSALWAVYGFATLFAGVGSRARWLRLSGATALAIVVAKLVLYDLWLLRTGYRVIAFVGVGVLLLLASLMYQRLRDLILEPDA